MVIDPIDGTYDYINNLEEFTINAGLIIKKTCCRINKCYQQKKECFILMEKGKSFELSNGKKIN